MRCVVLALVMLTACGPKIADHPRASDLTKHLPAALEVERAKEGDPRVVKIHVWADAGVRALPHWKEDITDQLDYATQTLTPLLGIRLQIDGGIREWKRDGDPSAALAALADTDKGDGVTWVIGYVTPGDAASKAMSELGQSQPLGHYAVVRAWSEKAETELLASSLPDLKEAERNEVLGAHRRHKQTVVLLHVLAATLGAIGETDPTWIQNPTYSAKQHGFSDRNRELMTLAIDDRLAGGTDQTMAKKLLEAIEKAEWGGWVPADHDAVTTTLRAVIDAQKAGRTAAAIPTAAFDQYNRIRELARRGAIKDALIELDNLLQAYPGNAAMHQLKCEIMLATPGVADKGTRAACSKAADLAQGDPTPYMLVGEALAKSGDIAGARTELSKAEDKIGNLPEGQADAWKHLIALYSSLGALTWTEQAIAKAKLENDPAAANIAQTRARYGIPKGGKVPPDQEAALVKAVRGALDLVYAAKYGDAEKAIAIAEKKWPNAAGLAAARCDLNLRVGQIDGARANCNRALALYADESWALYLSGLILLRDASGTTGGIAKLKRAIEVDPELGQAWRALAKAYQRTKDKAALEKLAQDYQAKFGQPLPP